MGRLRLTEHQLHAIHAVCRAYQVTRLKLFGSATREDFNPARSDIDLLVEFAAGTDLGPWMARFFELQNQLQRVLGRNVDLVIANGVRNPYIVRSINQDRRVLYAA